MLNVRDDHHGFGRVQFKWGSGVGCRVPVLLHQCSGITIAVEGFNDPSLLNISVWGNLADTFCPVSSVRATATLCARGWWESKSRYRSEWVFFLKTVVVSEPSLFRVTLVSRNGQFEGPGPFPAEGRGDLQDPLQRLPQSVCRPDWQNTGPTAEGTQTGSSEWTPGTVGSGRACCTGVARH